jgi:hypothetical protein
MSHELQARAFCPDIANCSAINWCSFPAAQQRFTWPTFFFGVNQSSPEPTNMADDLATDIRDTKNRIHKLEQHIANNDFAGTPYDDRTEAKAALTQLNYQLTTLYDTRRAAQTQQQQQSSAGTSMLPVHEEVVMFPRQISCCILATSAVIRVCLVTCNPAQLRPAPAEHL